MLFNSLQFLIFFPIVVGIYFALAPKYRWMLLLAASYYFYACWKVEYLILILFSTAIDYYASNRMGRIVDKKKRRPWLYLSLFVNLGMLFMFKYFTLFNESTREVFQHFNLFYGMPAWELLLPVGISFYTFQTLSYSIDVYNGKLKPEKHYGQFSLYVAFFPQLVAGPIERATHLLPQFHKHHSFDYQRFVGGVQQMLWGFFKKIVIADRLAIYVQEVYAHPGDENGITLLIGTYFFAFQIYCDFSGYSDIAIGAARIMGYDLMDNFRTPYLSKSVREFWTRWHISLSTWFRDYLYIPLGGNRVVKWRWYMNLMLVFLVSGFWHGANWTFLVWGGIHGVALIVETWVFPLWETGPLKKLGKFGNLIRVALCFHLVLLAWVFFRAESVGDAGLIIQKITTLPLHLNGALISESLARLDGSKFFVTFLLLILFAVMDPIIDQRIKALKEDTRIPYAKLIFAVILALTVIFGSFGKVEFIYFQF